MPDISLFQLDFLIVEDSPTQALQLQEALEKQHVRVEVAKDGMEALDKLNSHLPAVVISDIEMPRMNGYDLCRHLKNNDQFKEVVVVLLTNLTDPMDVIRGIECGADSFLTKPWEIHFLLATVANILENKKLHQTTGKGNWLEFFFGGKRHLLRVDQVQITDLLLSTFSNAIQKNLELEKAYRRLNLTYEELERKNEELEKLNSKKNQLLGMAAHDLRNPLTAIHGYSDLILRQSLDGSLPPEKLINMTEKIRTSSSFMLQLINDLLDLSVIEAGTVHLHLTDTNLRFLLQESIALSKELADKKNISIAFHCPEKIPTVRCDANKIAQVFNNLLSNAIKFSHEKSTVAIDVTPLETEIIIAVKDQGVGMPEEVTTRLFQPFFKHSGIGTAGEKGTGLGTAIAVKIITEHKGKIWAKSASDQGTTVFVSLAYEPFSQCDAGAP